MISVLSYTIEAGVILYLLTAFYGQVYNSLGYNKWNRVYLLAGALSCYLLPILKVTYYEEPAPDKFRITDIIMSHGAQFIAVDREMTLSLWWEEIKQSQLFEISLKILFAIYLAGVAVKLFIFVRGMIKTLALKRNPVEHCLDGVTVYRTGLKTVAFSFFRSIFLGTKSEGLSQEDLQVIFSHEFQHIRGCHSFDTLVFGFLSVLQWFNPSVRRASRFSRLVCENIADCKAAEGNSLTDYSRLILRLGENNITANSKHRSTLSDRILQLLDDSTDRGRKIWFVSSVPVLAIALAAYITLFGMFTRQQRGYDLPFDSESKLLTDYFEGQTYVDSNGDLFRVSHRQADFLVGDGTEIIAPFDAMVTSTDSTITLTKGKLEVTVGGVRYDAEKSEVSRGQVVGHVANAAHPCYIVVRNDGKVVDPGKVFKL